MTSKGGGAVVESDVQKSALVHLQGLRAKASQMQPGCCMQSVETTDAAAAGPLPPSHLCVRRKPRTGPPVPKQMSWAQRQSV